MKKKVKSKKEATHALFGIIISGGIFLWPLHAAATKWSERLKTKALQYIRY